MKYTIAGDSWRIHMQHSQTPDAPVSDTTEALVVAVDTAVRAAYPTVSWAERYYILADLFEAIEEIPDQASEMPVYTEDPAIPGWSAQQEVEEFKQWWGEVTDEFIALMPSGDADFVRLAMRIPLLHVLKGLDYGKPGDTFFNVRNSVRRVEAITGIGLPDYVGAILRAVDKESRISSFFARGNLANESIADAFQDMANYYLIAWRLLAESVGIDPLTGESREWSPRETEAVYPVSTEDDAPFEFEEDEPDDPVDYADSASDAQPLPVPPKFDARGEAELAALVKEILADPNRVIQTNPAGKFVGFGTATQVKPGRTSRLDEIREQLLRQEIREQLLRLEQERPGDDDDDYVDG